MKKYFRSAALAAAVAAVLLPVPNTAAHAQSDQISPADHGGGAHVLFTPQIHGQRGAAAPSGAVSPNDLTYHGGPIMRDSTNYVIIWNPPGSSFSPTYQQLIEQYFTDVGGTPFMTINSQYGDSSGAAVPNTNHFGGTWVDLTNAYPHAGTVADPLTGQDIRDEIDRAIAANPTWHAPGLSTMYFVYLGHNIIECFKGAADSFGCFAGTDVNGNSPSNGTYCAYHSFFGGGPRVYATMPYASDGSCFGSPSTFPNGVDQDIVLSPTSHEQFEAYSDPMLNAWFNDATGNENGDNCAYTYGQVEPDGTNIVLNGHRYQLQREWSNALPGLCIKRLGPASQLTLTGDLNFGVVPRGTLASRTVSVQDTAAGDLNLLNIRLGPGAPASFSINPASPRWGTVPSGDAVDVLVTFAPSATATTIAPLSTTLIVDTDQPGFETQSFAMTATIGQPKAVLTPGSLNFDTVCPGGPIDLQLTVSNLGQAPLTITGVTIGGGSSAGLSVLPTPSVPVVVPAGASISFTVRFTPGAPGPIVGSVVVTTHDPVNPVQSVPVTGAVGAPSAALGSSALDFGGVPTDNRTSPNVRDLPLTIGNAGACGLTLTSLSIGGPNAGDFSIVGAPALPVSIGAGSSLTLTVRFNPSAPGPRNATLQFATNDPAKPTVSVALTGLGLIPAIQTSSNSLVYQPTVILSQAPGYVGAIQNLTVTNVGQAELIVDVMSTSGAPFTAPGATNPPARFAPSDSFNEPVTFGPVSAGKFTGTFTVSDTNPEGPVSKTVQLCGEGVGRGIRVLVVGADGTPVPSVSKLHLQSHGTAQNVNIDVMDLPLTSVVTSCNPNEKMQYENQSLPATDTVNQRSSYYNLDVTTGGTATTVTFTLGVSEFKTLVVTVK